MKGKQRESIFKRGDVLGSFKRYKDITSEKAKTIMLRKIDIMSEIKSAQKTIFSLFPFDFPLSSAVSFETAVVIPDEDMLHASI